jgi:hypothetical protein
MEDRIWTSRSLFAINIAYVLSTAVHICIMLWALIEKRTVNELLFGISVIILILFILITFGLCAKKRWAFWIALPLYLIQIPMVFHPSFTYYLWIGIKTFLSLNVTVGGNVCKIGVNVLPAVATVMLLRMRNTLT